MEEKLSQAVRQKLSSLADCEEQRDALVVRMSPEEARRPLEDLQLTSSVQTLSEEVEALLRGVEALKERCSEQSCCTAREAILDALWRPLPRLHHCTRRLAARSERRTGEWREILQTVGPPPAPPAPPVLHHRVNVFLPSGGEGLRRPGAGGGGASWWGRGEGLQRGAAGAAAVLGAVPGPAGLGAAGPVGAGAAHRQAAGCPRPPGTGPAHTALSAAAGHAGSLRQVRRRRGGFPDTGGNGSWTARLRRWHLLTCVCRQAETEEQRRAGGGPGGAGGERDGLRGAARRPAVGGGRRRPPQSDGGGQELRGASGGTKVCSCCSL